MPDEDDEPLDTANTDDITEGEAKQLPRPPLVVNVPSAASPRNRSGKTVRQQTITATRQHQGPLPTTEYLREINEIIPNGAERIMAMAESHAAHSQRMEQQELEAIIAHDKGELARSNRGLLAGFVVAMSFGIGSIYLIATGHEVPGTVFGTVDIVALASVFVIGRVYTKQPPKKEQSAERSEDDPPSDDNTFIPASPQT